MEEEYFRESFAEESDRVIRGKGGPLFRDKIKEFEPKGELEKNKALDILRKVFGSSKHKTTDEDIHKAREKAFEELDKELD